MAPARAVAWIKPHGEGHDTKEALPRVGVAVLFGVASYFLLNPLVGGMLVGLIEKIEWLKNAAGEDAAETVVAILLGIPGFDRRLARRPLREPRPGLVLRPVQQSVRRLRPRLRPHRRRGAASCPRSSCWLLRRPARC